MAQIVIATITIRNQRLNDIMRMTNIIARHATSTLHAQSRLAKKHAQITQTATTDTCVTKNTVEMQDARWDRMAGIWNTLQLFHISSG